LPTLSRAASCAKDRVRLPWGGERDSGLGREHGTAAIENFTEPKAGLDEPERLIGRCCRRSGRTICLPQPSRGRRAGSPRPVRPRCLCCDGVISDLSEQAAAVGLDLKLGLVSDECALICNACTAQLIEARALQTEAPRKPG